MSNLQQTTKFWEEETTALYEERPRSVIPALPQVADPIQTFKSRRGQEKLVLAYLACVIRDTDDKMITMRALASAVSVLFSDSSNFTGSATTSVDLTGLDILADDSISNTTTLSTNFDGAPPLQVADVDPYLDADIDEIGGYFGDIFMAGTKRLTTQNATAFNEKRLNVILASTAVPPKIFVAGSSFLDERVLNRVYASFTSLAAIRAQLIHRTAQKVNTIRYGPSVTFMAIFLLLADNGMGTLAVIKEAVLKCPWIRTDFPELRPELEAADRGQKTLRAAEPSLRPFVKVIFGSAFVPVPRNEVQNLFGVCKKVMTHYAPTYRQFGGGVTTPQQDDRIAQRLGIQTATAPEGGEQI